MIREVHTQKKKDGRNDADTQKADTSIREEPSN